MQSKQCCFLTGGTLTVCSWMCAPDVCLDHCHSMGSRPSQAPCRMRQEHTAPVAPGVG